MVGALPRLARRLRAFCRAASVSVCAVACLLWAAGIDATHMVTWHRPHRPGPGFTIVSVISGGGSLELTLTRDPVGELVRPGVRYRTVRAGRNMLGDLSMGRLEDGTEVTWFVELPYWAIILVTGTLPLMRSASRRRERQLRQRRLDAGLCPACAYDLRGSSGRCPECGTAAVAGREI